MTSVPNIPLETIEIILRYLHPLDFIGCRLVCRLWFKLIRTIKPKPLNDDSVLNLVDQQKLMTDLIDGYFKDSYSVFMMNNKLYVNRSAYIQLPFQKVIEYKSLSKLPSKTDPNPQFIHQVDGIIYYIKGFARNNTLCIKKTNEHNFISMFVDSDEIPLDLSQIAITQDHTILARDYKEDAIYVLKQIDNKLICIKQIAISNGLGYMFVCGSNVYVCGFEQYEVYSIEQNNNLYKTYKIDDVIKYYKINIRNNITCLETAVLTKSDPGFQVIKSILKTLNLDHNSTKIVMHCGFVIIVNMSAAEFFTYRII